MLWKRSPENQRTVFLVAEGDAGYFNASEKILHLRGFLLHLGHRFQNGLHAFQHGLDLRQIGHQQMQLRDSAGDYAERGAESDIVGRGDPVGKGVPENQHGASDADQRGEGRVEAALECRIVDETGGLAVVVEPAGEGTVLAARQFQLLDTGKEIVLQTAEFGSASGIFLPHVDRPTIVQQEHGILYEDDRHSRPEQLSALNIDLREVNDIQNGV